MRYISRLLFSVWVFCWPFFALAATPPTVNLGQLSAPPVSQSFIYGFDTVTGIPRAIATDATGEIYCNNCSGGSGGGGAVTMATGAAVDGWNVTMGTKADAAYSGTGSGSEIALLKYVAQLLASPLPAGTNALGGVTVSNFPSSQAVTGTFWQATQPVSAASLPLPTGAATAANQVAGVAAGTSGTNVMPVQGVSGGVALPVSGTFWQSTQPVSGTFLTPVAPATATATQGVLNGCLANSTPPTFTAGQQGAVTCDLGGRIYVNIGANTLGNLPTYLQAVTSGGSTTATTYALVNSAAAVINATVKSGAGQIFEINASNSNASGVWCRLYNLTSTTTGSGTPIWRIYVPPTSDSVTIPSDIGLSFGTGLTVVCTAGAADTDTSTIATANSVMINFSVK